MPVIRRGLAAVALVSALFLGAGVTGAHAQTQEDKTEAADACDPRFAWKVSTVCDQP